MSPPIAESEPVIEKKPPISDAPKPSTIQIPPLKKSQSGAEIKLPTPEPMDYEDTKPSITKPPQQSSQDEPEKVSTRHRSSEASSKKAIPPPFKESSVEMKHSSSMSEISASPPKKRKSQTPRISESSKEATPSSPLAQKHRLPHIKTEMPIRDRRRKIQPYTPPTSPAPKTPHIEQPEDFGIKDEIVLSSDASRLGAISVIIYLNTLKISRASSRLSSSVQASALSSAVPSARSSEERSKTDSRQSQIIPVILRSTTKLKASQTALSVASGLSKSAKRPSTSNVAPLQIKRSSKSGKFDVGCQTFTPFNVANEVTWNSDANHPLPEDLIKALNEIKKVSFDYGKVDVVLKLCKFSSHLLESEPLH